MSSSPDDRPDNTPLPITGSGDDDVPMLKRPRLELEADAAPTVAGESAGSPATSQVTSPAALPVSAVSSPAPMVNSAPPRVALVHEWLDARGGSERVVEAMLDVFPQAPIYTLIHRPDAFRDTPIARADVRTSALQHLLADRGWRLALPFMPYLMEQFDLDAWDVVLSSNHVVAKGVLTRAEQLHISYVHSPMRYAWDLYQFYDQRPGFLPKLRAYASRPLMHYLRLWDHAAADRVDRFLANSTAVAARIRKYYRRDADVLHPPVDVTRFRADQERGDACVVVARLAPMKRIDLAVTACTRLRLPLKVIGDGPERARLEALAGPTVQFLGELPDRLVAQHLQTCRLVLQPAEEDFGMTAVEAQAAGAPVLAYGRGGARDTVRDGVTGLYFASQDVDAVAGALRRFAECAADLASPAELHAHAATFDRERFTSALRDYVAAAWDEHQRLGPRTR